VVKDVVVDRPLQVCQANSQNESLSCFRVKSMAIHDNVFFSHRPQSSATISLSAVSSVHSCELAAGLHHHIHNKFMNILGQAFKPIPSSSEYFYFYSSPRRQTMVCVLDMFILYFFAALL